MSGVDYFDDQAAINPFMDASVAVNKEKAAAEHQAIRASLEQAGVKVIQTAPPPACQDGVYTANWALVRGDTAVLACLPNARKGEEAYAEKVLTELGKKVIRVPEGLKFSGQGDALPCGNYLFAGQGYRSDTAAQQFAAGTLGYELIQLQAIPLLDENGEPKTNEHSGWPDSFFYDVDLALSILRQPLDGQKGLIAWCPEAFTEESCNKLAAFDAVEKIEVSLAEAKEAFACNLVSTGETIIMSARAPHLQSRLENHGFQVITPEISELAKGGGYIRCTTLTLDN
ncbi:MAG TPA: arginine deiminase-related protein [Nitrososphaera sp.]|nr:arginine deiminase-related protein [Nitrososphaera sp.]